VLKAFRVRAAGRADARADARVCGARSDRLASQLKSLESKQTEKQREVCVCVRVRRCRLSLHACLARAALRFSLHVPTVSSPFWRAVLTRIGCGAAQIVELQRKIQATQASAAPSAAA
jgi:hypothetical protein